MATVIIAATVSSHLTAFHLRWVRTLRAAGLTVIGAASDIEASEQCREAFDSVLEVPFSRNALCRKQMLQSGKRLQRLRSDSGAQLVHFHTPNAAFWGRLALRGEVERGECRVAYTAHGFHFHKAGNVFVNCIYRCAEHLAGKYTNALLTINCEDAEEAKRFKLANGGFHEQLPGAGIDLQRFDPSKFDRNQCRSALAATLNLPLQVRTVLMVAEFTHGKRHRDALRAFADPRLRDTHLLFAGAGSEETRMTSLTYQLGIADRVHFLGRRVDIPHLLVASDAVILPSEREGLPVSILEAMAMRKPVVVANARGNRDLVRPDCGWMHEIGDSRMLASLLQHIFDHPEEAAERGDKARQRVVSCYGWPVVEQKLTAVYGRLNVPLSPNGSSLGG